MRRKRIWFFKFLIEKISNLYSNLSNNKTQQQLPDTDHIARICKSSACTANGVSAAAFELRLDYDTRADDKQEYELSVHWIEYFKNEPFDQKIQALREHLLRPAFPLERKIKKNEKIAVLPVEPLHQNLVSVPEMGDINIGFCCVHSPRQDYDSHSSICTNPAAKTWDPDRVSAYKFAVSKFLAELAQPELLPIYQMKSNQ